MGDNICILTIVSVLRIVSVLVIVSVLTIVSVLIIDRHHCFISSNIPKTEGGLIHLSFVAILRSLLNLTQKGGFA